MKFSEKYFIFPNQRHVELWGDREVAINFVGGPYLIRGLNKSQEDGIYNHFGDLVSKRDTTTNKFAVESYVFRKPSNEFRDFGLSDREYTLDIDTQDSFIRVAGLRLMAHIDFKPLLKGALWTSEQGSDWFPSMVFENYLRILVAYRLLECGGALLHSAGIADGHEAYLILGHSGAGKTTFSRNSLAEGYTVLSDDLNALLWNKNIPVIEKVPFSGDLGRTNTRSKQYPLKTIYCLQKHHDIIIHPPLGPAESIAMLISCSPYINIDNYRITQLINNMGSLIQAVPVQKLSFSLDGNVSSVLKTNYKGSSIHGQTTFFNDVRA